MRFVSAAKLLQPASIGHSADRIAAFQREGDAEAVAQNVAQCRLVNPVGDQGNCDVTVAVVRVALNINPYPVRPAPQCGQDYIFRLPPQDEMEFIRDTQVKSWHQFTFRFSHKRKTPAALRYRKTKVEARGVALASTLRGTA